MTHQREYRPFKRQPNIMVKHTQTISLYLSVFDHFVGLSFKDLKSETHPAIFSEKPKAQNKIRWTFDWSNWDWYSGFQIINPLTINVPLT